MAVNSQLGIIILAGGLGKRVGGANKALMMLNGQPMLQQVIQQIKDCSEHIIISANRDITLIQQYDYPVCSDLPTYRHMGPLAGIISAATLLPPQIDFIQIVPCDLPFITSNIIEHLYQQLHHQPELHIVYAADPSKQHPIVCQMRRHHLTKVEQQLNSTGKHSMRSIIEPYPHSIVTFNNSIPFTNYNNSAMFASCARE